MKVFVVTKGEYSDYRIEGVYSTREKAEDACRLLCAEINDIAEYDVDAILEHPQGMMHYVVLSDVHGNVRETGIKSVSDMPKDWEWMPLGDDKNVEFHVWATDESHAVKIVGEKRARLIAENKWTSDWSEWKNRIHAARLADEVRHEIR